MNLVRNGLLVSSFSRRHDGPTAPQVYNNNNNAPLDAPQAQCNITNNANAAAANAHQTTNDSLRTLSTPLWSDDFHDFGLKLVNANLYKNAFSNLERFGNITTNNDHHDHYDNGNNNNALLDNTTQQSCAAANKPEREGTDTACLSQGVQLEDRGAMSVL